LPPARSEHHTDQVHVSERVAAGRLALAAFALFLGAQFEASRYVGEPYPALSMPAFPGLPDSDIAIPVLHVVVGQYIFGINDLFPNVPDNLRQYLGDSFMPATKAQLDRPALYRVFPKARVANVNYARRIESPVVRRWLRTRLETLTGGSVPSAEIQWVREGRTADGRPIRTATDSTVVKFDGND